MADSNVKERRAAALRSPCLGENEGEENPGAGIPETYIPTFGSGNEKEREGQPHKKGVRAWQGAAFRAPASVVFVRAIRKEKKLTEGRPRILSCLLFYSSPAALATPTAEMNCSECECHIDVEMWRAAVSSARVNFFFEFIDPVQQSAFVDFKCGQFSSSYYSFPLSTIITAVLLTYWAIVLHDEHNALTIIASTFTVLFPIPLLWIIVCAKQRKIKTTKRLQCLLENCFLLSSCIAFGLIIILRTSNPLCDTVSFLEIWSCAPLTNYKNISPEAPIALMFLPVLCSITLSAISSLYLFFCYVWIVGIMLFALLYNRSLFAIAWVLTTFCIAVVLHCVTSWTQVQLFVYFTKVEELNRQREEDAARQAIELRELIGKMAHDIRTVSADYAELTFRYPLRDTLQLLPFFPRFHAPIVRFSRSHCTNESS